ncbi:MAG TPA: hypothetical protein IGR64_05965 [Leptolyngbyaceae cyanobacterium M65_K2018_010]|nr:hypothetical protein [Leptolyngbyaceae cyanobacterium M65_K2018_010]
MKSLKPLKLNPAVFNRLPAFFRDPIALAVLLSLGFHGLLFAAGPSFSSLKGVAAGEAAGEEERRVPLIELSPEEQSRLPDFSSSAFALTPSDGGDFMPLFPPLADNPSSLPFSARGGLSALPEVPVTKPPRPSTLGISPFPSTLGRGTLTIPTLPRLPQSSGANPTQPPSNGSATANGATAANGRRAGTGANSDNEPTAADLQMPRRNATNGSETAALPGETNDSAENTRSQDLIARVEYSPERTTAAEVETAQTEWVRAVEERLGPTTAVEEPLTVEVPYDVRICLNPAPIDGILGVVVLPGEDPNTWKLATQVLKSTGYPFLNQAAEQRLQAQVAEAEDPLEMGALYRAIVRVNYNAENCISRDSLLKSRGAPPATPGTAPQEAGSNPPPSDTE